MAIKNAVRLLTLDPSYPILSHPLHPSYILFCLCCPPNMQPRGFIRVQPVTPKFVVRLSFFVFLTPLSSTFLYSSFRARGMFLFCETEVDLEMRGMCYLYNEGPEVDLSYASVYLKKYPCSRTTCKIGCLCQGVWVRHQWSLLSSFWRVGDQFERRKKGGIVIDQMSWRWFKRWKGTSHGP